MKCSKQELLCFVRIRHELIERENWIVSTPTFFMVHKKSLNDNWTKTGSFEPTFLKWSYKGVPIKLTDGLFKYKLNFVPI